ncbi:MAG: hypothetical protein GF421_08040 [Candidatus Aminicenantes bacterium]|nr:hypothetical protein [Candidatus Aminicenantes bacterium]
MISRSRRLLSFPHNPGTAGLIDTGPLVGLWFLAISIRILFSLKCIKTKNDK